MDITLDAKIITPARFQDERGFFSETWNHKRFYEEVADVSFVQDNHSMSNEPGTVRGLHFQAPPFAQAKLVRCGRGRLFDVAVDIRKGSPNYGKWIGEELSFENGKQMFIPVGFLHGFVTLEPFTEIIYKCSNFYNFASEGCVKFDDPEINIEWPLDMSKALVSEKDASALRLSQIDNPFSVEDF